MAFPTQSILLNGSTQYLTAADSASLSPTGNQTHEGHVKFGTLPSSGNEMAIFSKYDTTGNQRGLAVTLKNTAGTYTFVTRTSTDGTLSSAGTTVTWTPSTGTWYFLRFVYSTAGTIDIYVDDLVTKLGQSTGLDGSIFDNTALYRLGETDFTAQTMNGRFGLWRVWNTTHTTSDKCTFYGSAQTNLKAEWSLNNTLSDTSGNANTLTNVATGTFGADVNGVCPVGTTGATFFMKMI